ncbi:MULTISPECIES: sigma-E factor negative regulatory protein [unclassified Acidovorax]|uniref:sigma-E factor negative regulatory protein n=1 Tax=unclassified Acidovorax TaxID=2684926 RepID=UPI0009E9D6DC|nr:MULTISPECIES: sigma-E factor negative regulatory protein [unclassified Acidovorax]PUA99468.1 RseA-like anti sigma(E) protein [Acidovorax sp. 107]
MNKAETGINVSAGVSLREGLGRGEQLSALADGQLQGDEFAAALAWAAEDEGRDTWEVYHLVGDVLRSSELARPVSPAFLSRLREELAKEAPPQRPQVPAQLDNVAVHLPVAANASVFRWKMVAGFASLAAVAAIGWTSFSQLQGAGGAGSQLAAAPEGARAQGAPVVAVADADGQQVMIRDPRLDELLAAHKQFGSTSALQMPAGFLRNATFETPGR